MTQAPSSQEPVNRQQMDPSRRRRTNWNLLRGVSRILLLFFTLILFALVGGFLFGNVDPVALANQTRATNPFFAKTPEWLLQLGAAIFNRHSVIYMLPPLAAFLFVYLAAARYVEDVYNLPNLKLALRYEFTSIFGLFGPRLNIKDGTMDIPDGKTNTLDAIGGPGCATIQPGNVVLFRHLRRPSSAPDTGAYFMSPFENIEQIANLDDQRETIPEISAVTRDGILIVVRNVQFHFRIHPQRTPTGDESRTVDNPYPYSNAAVFAMAYNLTVDENGDANWHKAVRGAISGGISEFINHNTVDELTAPRSNRLDPRAQIQREMFSEGMHNRLANIGAELLWIDVGHMDIVDELVDDQRVHFWQAHWIGKAETIRAYGAAKRQTYLEQGRAEAQAEMVMSILSALENRQADTASKEEIERLILTRTAEILDAMTESHPSEVSDGSSREERP